MNQQGYRAGHSGTEQDAYDYSAGGAWYAPPPAQPPHRTRVRANAAAASAPASGWDNRYGQPSEPATPVPPARTAPANPAPQAYPGPVREERANTVYPTAYHPASSGGGKNGGTPPRGGNRPQKSGKGIGLTILVAVILILVVAGGIGFAKVRQVQNTVRPYTSVFLSNVYVDGVALGGMSWEEGRAAVETHLAQKKNSWYITLKNEYGARNITADMLGIAWDPTAALEQAWAVGHGRHSGVTALFDQQKEIQQALAREEGHHFSSAQQSADTAQIDTILSSLEQAAYRAPADAVFLGFDPDNTDQPFSYQREVWGQRLDTGAIRGKILSLVENLECGEVLLETTPIPPAVTVDDLSVNYELRFRAITPISDKSTEDRTGNIRLAFSRINGLKLKDGETFSFNKTVGRRSVANGFNAAVEYIYGQEEMGVGGGVCQASTTVYLAAIQSGMTVTRRRPHSMAVSYTDLGKDATVSDTKGHEIDFTFKNNCGGTVYLTAHVISSPTNRKKLMCEVRIYGPSLNGTRYELVSNVTETLPKPEEPILKDDKNGDYVTYTDQKKTVIKGREGYVVESWLVTYQNNIETGRKLVYTDTYPCKADTVYVGVTPRE